MDLSLTDEQQMLAQTVREMCARFSTPEIVREFEDDPIGFRRDLWAELARADLLGIGIPEDHGGMGMGLLEQAIVSEELGRALCPSPFLTSAVLGAAAVRLAGSAEDRALLAGIARGDEVVACAWYEPGGGEGEEGVRATFDDGRVRGEKILVPFASAATRYLVLARSGAGVDLYLVDADAAGIVVEQQKTMAADAAFSVRFDGAPGVRLGAAGSGWAAWTRALDEGLVALAAYATGGAARAHELAVEYAKEREQFGRKIGAFQGIAHPLADTATDIEGARVLVWQAAWAHASGRRDFGPLAAMAKYYACDTFRRTTKTGQQTFGGIGFIRDVDMQLYFRRAKQMELLWLGPRALEERIAAAELDAAVPFVSMDAGA